MLPAFVFHGIACCDAPFIVPATGLIVSCGDNQAGQKNGFESHWVGIKSRLLQVRDLLI